MPFDGNLANLTQIELNKLIDDRIENRIRSRMIGQNDILPQTIKERHIDWEEMGTTVTSSIIDHISEDIVIISSLGSASLTVNTGDSQSVTVIISDIGGSATRVIMAVMHITAYESSVSAANRIPDGSGLAYDDYIRHTAHDWGSNNNLYASLIDTVRNDSGGNETVLWRVNARYIGKQTSTG